MSTHRRRAHTRADGTPVRATTVNRADGRAGPGVSEDSRARLEAQANDAVTGPVDLTSLSPADIDGTLAEFMQTEAVMKSKIEGAWTRMHSIVGYNILGENRVATPEETSQVLAEIDETPEEERSRHEQQVWDLYDDQTVWQSTIDENQLDGALYRDEYRRRGGWPRAYLVSNNNGHVHRDMACATCTATTDFYWVTDLSGSSEDEIVEAAGERACTVCYPSAPVDVLARPTRVFSPDEEEAARKRDERAAAKTERDRKRLEKALMPDGQPLRVPIGRYPKTFKTLASARTWLTDAAMWNEGRDEPHPSFPTDAVDTVAQAVAAKESKTVDEVLDEASKRAARRR